MSRYPIYLEVTDSLCMAHILDLPGCTLRAPSRTETLARLPAAILDHLAWLRRHGEPIPPADDPVEIEVAGESHGFGPFDPDDTAALFPPDRVPLTPAEMEAYFRLMAHARADLLSLVEPLPDDLLDRQPDPDSWAIRRILRHIGNAEEWYVSRLVPPDTLPPEWEHDDELPVFEFLAMERRTAIDRLRRLTAEELAVVVYPTCWTNHPDEPWTARKSFRRAVEHEREHTGQIQEMLMWNH